MNYSDEVEIIDNKLMNYKINLIIENHSFKHNLLYIQELEKHREFCKHDINHFLDVARIMYIMKLENTLNIPKHIIYATALLHDIGRGRQYEDGTPHDIASVEIAKNILLQCNYDTKEIGEILGAIGKHRNNNENLNGLSYLLYKCDKLSRNCIYCKATYNCNWKEEQKNFKITY
ncbi:MAG: HD domain-containing protein [Clostridiaceae bacterium]|nr:HD domain-containing protein [Clostridiaceae bacterium]